MIGDFVPEPNILSELVVCSLEPWDEVWRRNQVFTDNLLRRNPGLRVLFVEPPADPLFDLTRWRAPATPRLRVIGYDGRLRAFRPLKVLPRRAGVLADHLLRSQVRLTARLLDFSRPTLWINDVTYSPLIRSTGWPTVYDVTDDWLAAPFPRRELERIETLDRIALDEAEAVVVCSSALEESRGRYRPVVVVPNGVDPQHFRRPRSRPVDLPAGRVAVYVGSLHESRLDVDLVVELARRMPALHVVLVGPDSLERSTRRRLSAEPNVTLLGARPYEAVPAYLQHADVIVVPHLVNGFTESLDPIKAYECLAAGRPTVATPVAGFRGLEPEVELASRELFSRAVETKLAGHSAAPAARTPPTWEDRAREFSRVLLSVRLTQLEERRERVLQQPDKDTPIDPSAA
jgi:glycosyltransferase involved in cell wall biosynthesis